MVYWTEQLGMVVAMIMTVSQMSILYGDNFFFRWSARVVIGYGIAYSIAWGFNNLNYVIYEPIFVAKTSPTWYVIPWLFGFLLYFRLWRRYAWLYKYPIAVTMGISMGTVITSQLRGEIFDQLGYTITDLFGAGTAMEAFNALVVLIGVTTVISYFFFTREHTGVLGISAMIGRIFIMASIAVIWAGDYMWAMAMMAGRLKWIINDVILGFPWA